MVDVDVEYLASHNWDERMPLRFGSGPLQEVTPVMPTSIPGAGAYANRTANSVSI